MIVSIIAHTKKLFLVLKRNWHDKHWNIEWNKTVIFIILWKEEEDFIVSNELRKYRKGNKIKAKIKEMVISFVKKIKQKKGKM